MSTKQTMTDLRGHLFDVIESLKAPEPMEIATAETICLAARRLLDSAEIEIRYRNVINQTGHSSTFLEDKR